MTEPYRSAPCPTATAVAVTATVALAGRGTVPPPRTCGDVVPESRVSAVPVEFEEFAAARGPALVRLARGLLRDPHHAEDVVQDVLAKALVSWHRVQAADDPDAYVRRMVVNACTSFWRRAVRRERPVEHESLPDAGVGDTASAGADRDLLLGMLRELPTKQRAVLVLRHYEGLPDVQIADLLGCSAVTVRSNAHRGLASLRRMLEEGRS